MGPAFCAGLPTGRVTGLLTCWVVSLQEQQQVLLYQLMQQQQDLQQIHAQMPLTPSSSSSSSAQLPVGGLQPAPQGGPGAITSNPFLAMQHAHADGGPKPRLTADKTEKT